MCDLRFALECLRTWLLTALLVALSGCASGAGGRHTRPHAARDTAIPKLESRPPMVARDEVAMAFPDEAGGVDSPPDERVEEIVVTGARRETTASPELGATAGPPPAAAVDGSADERAGLLTEVDRILAGLPLGNAAFGVPPQMKVGERTTARLRLSLQESAATLAAEIGRLSPDAAAVLSDPVRVHTVMLARLDGTSGLEIRLLGGQEERTLDSAATEEWVWEVTAVQPGAESVHLELFAVIEVQGEQRKNLRRSWDAVVAVEVPPLPPVLPASKWSALLAWVGKNFQWLWAAILVPLGGLAYRTYQARRRKEPPPGFTEIKEASKESTREATEVTDHAD
ncbi:MAG: hypothetical protein KBI44_13635 [Thermoanaerobaculia bacterium]|nr:hypothetical protein [Thermoanaerobaculia bacterium]